MGSPRTRHQPPPGPAAGQDGQCLPAQPGPSWHLLPASATRTVTHPRRPAHNDVTVQTPVHAAWLTAPAKAAPVSEIDRGEGDLPARPAVPRRWFGRSPANRSPACRWQAAEVRLRDGEPVVIDMDRPRSRRAGCLTTAGRPSAP